MTVNRYKYGQKAVVAYLKQLSQHSTGETEENHTKSSLRMARNSTEILTGYHQYRKLELHRYTDLRGRRG